MSNVEDFEVVGSFTSMPDTPGVLFVVYDPLPGDPTSGAILQFGSSPRADFPLQAQIHPGKAILEWDWTGLEVTASVVRHGAVVAREAEGGL